MSNLTAFRREQTSIWMTAFISLAFLLAAAGRPALAQQVYSTEASDASCFTDAAGNLYVWGFDQYNRTISAVTNATALPVAVAQDSVPVLVQFPSGVTQWTAVSPGVGHVLLTGNDGNLYSWGANSYGQLGNGGSSGGSIPGLVTKPATVTTWKVVAAGAFHSYAIGSNDSLYAWGFNSWGQLGAGVADPGGNSATGIHSTPTSVINPASVTGWKAVAAGNNFGLAIAANDSLYAWGRNANGQLGQGNTTDKQVPTVVGMPAGVTKWTKVFAGGFFSLAMGDDGNLYAWGQNNNGQLGDSTTTQRTSPVKVKLPTGVASWTGVAAVGASFVAAVGSDGNLYAWGYNGTGELGLNTGTSNNPYPKAVTLPGSATAAAVAAGHNHMLVVCSDGYVYAWGRNTSGELGRNSTTGNGTNSVPNIAKVFGVVVVTPETPVSISPSSGTTGLSVSGLILKWSSAPHGLAYQCQVSMDPTFATVFFANDSALADTSDTLNSLGYSTKYYWRVRSYNNGVFSSYSAKDSFTTIMLPPEPTAVVAPATDAVNQPARDTLVCRSAVGAAMYHWQVSTGLAFSALVMDDSTADTVVVTPSLLSGTKYYWQVRAVNPGGVSAFAGPDSFTVMNVPGSPALFLPAHGEGYQRSDTLTFKWHPSATAIGYGIQIADSISFSVVSIAASNDSVADTTFVATKLKNLTKYYWRVRAYNPGGVGAYSSPDSFTTIISVPDKPNLVLPAISSTGVPRRTTFSWRVSVRAESYRMQIATDYHYDSTGAYLPANVVFDAMFVSGTDTSFQLSSPLDAAKKYFWHVAGIDTGGTGLYSDGVFTTGTGILSVGEGGGIPIVFALMQNYPNPFNPTTLIRYDVPRSSEVVIAVYDILGRQVAMLVDGLHAPGKYSVQFNASRFASGVYFFRMNAGSFNKIMKMMLVK